ncbi:MAG TPA: glycosyl hydrolase 115 family protein, partial [Opitutus sp.]|nr:glycosyl hydrolase 115 family protein [Opitutus sp.]
PQPLPGVERALVIAGSDKRGTIYGIYEVSQQIGVSPWYWWADAVPEHHDALFVKAGVLEQGPPAVKYRGIFLNDEAPDLTNWIQAKFGTVKPGDNPPVPPGIANYGHEFYAKLFELMLRLRANYLWPAMWNNAFNEDDPLNPQLADEYGIVMGTSHQEPMLRAQKEWDRRYEKTLGHWNYAERPEVLQQFWRDGIRRNKDYASIITMGLRGANDTPMAPGGPEANMKLLEQIVGVQRDILREEMNPDVTKIPQVWCLYKEVQEFYEHGMRVPDDVTLLWAEDNWGNVRRLPTAEERKRGGGAGIYYHFDYHGGPRSYQWINTSPIAKIWDQMSLAKQYGADRIWIVNVGHFKGYEFPLEYFLDLAWDPHRWTNENLDAFTRAWAAREFGAEHAAAIAGVIERYTKYNGRRKPELLAPDTYSLVNYDEAERVVGDYAALAAQAEAIGGALPPDKQDEYYELVLFPAKASALVNEIYLAAARNALYAQQGRASAREQAAETHRLFDRFMAMTDHFNGDFAGGKWAHFMDQPVLGYTTWRDPPENSLLHLTLVEPAVPEFAGFGVAVEGSAATVDKEGALPRFDALNRQRSYIDVFNRGRIPFPFTAKASEPWIVLDRTEGRLGPDQRIGVTIDWSQAPAGLAHGTVTLSGGLPSGRAKQEVVVDVTTLSPPGITRDTLHGFAEGQGVVSIEAEHSTGRTASGDRHWIRIEDYGRTLSGMRAEAPVEAPAATPGTDAPCLSYDVYLFEAGKVDVAAILAPTMNFLDDRPLRCAISFDDEPPQTVTIVPAGYNAGNGNRDWEKVVADNARIVHSEHTLAQPGYHTLKFWMVDPGVVLTKLVVDCGGLKPSYLGPPESFRGTAK